MDNKLDPFNPEYEDPFTLIKLLLYIRNAILIMVDKLPNNIKAGSSTILMRDANEMVKIGYSIKVRSFKRTDLYTLDSLQLNIRSLLRLYRKNHYISKEKYEVCMEMLIDAGKIIGTMITKEISRERTLNKNKQTTTKL